MELAIELVAYAIGAVIFTALGVLAEFNGVLRLVGGDPAAGTWLAFIGLLLLYAGVYLLGYERILTQLRSDA